MFLCEINLVDLQLVCLFILKGHSVLSQTQEGKPFISHTKERVNSFALAQL